MDYIINDREPAKLFHYFEDICAIPHGSGNEAGIAAYLCAFAEAHRLEHYRDSLDNVLIVREASPGLEGRPAVMLQGHTDMVCEKNRDTPHDFEHDPLRLYVEDGWLRARGTTLGGDDGIAVALMLALLDDDCVAHPRLECLFTVQEETGLNGAAGFDYSRITARRLINLDSEEEGVAVAGCAGGLRLTLKLGYDTVPAENKPVGIEITGLAGGHSGSDIHLGRANALKLAGRVLLSLYRDEPFNLISINGGSKTNAIPRECEAVIAPLDIDAVRGRLKELENELRHELSDADRGFRLRLTKAPKADMMLTYRDSRRLISLLTLVPCGVQTMSPRMQGLVEASVNPGILRTNSGNIELHCSLRSSVASVMSSIEMKFGELAKVIGLSVESGGRYPGWEYSVGSPLQRDYLEVFRSLFGESLEPRICALHAGLECGIIKSALGGEVDAISIGPNIFDIHTPGERLELASAERLWRLVCELLKR